MNGAANANGAEAAVAADEPVLETLEERERFYQEVSQPFAHTCRPGQALEKRSFFFFASLFSLARESPRGGEEEGDRGGEDG